MTSFLRPFFKHDIHSRNDPKLVAVQMKYGLRGVGAWWCIVEILYEQSNVISMSQCDSIAYALHEDSTWIAEIMQFFVSIKLMTFDENEQVFKSPAVEKRSAESDEIRREKTERARKAAQSRWKINEMQVHIEDNASAMQEQCETMPSRVEYSRVEKSREEKSNRERERETLMKIFSEAGMENELDTFLKTTEGKKIRYIQSYAKTYIDNRKSERTDADQKSSRSSATNRTASDAIAGAVERVVAKRRSK